VQASDFVAILLVLAAAFSYLNRRFLRLPTTVGLPALTLLASLAAVGVGLLFPAVEHRVAGFARQIDFHQAVLHGMLGFLLFAGAPKDLDGEFGNRQLCGLHRAVPRPCRRPDRRRLRPRPAGIRFAIARSE
jgi:CPA1 family monovalent cation:H+ antiporter